MFPHRSIDCSGQLSCKTCELISKISTYYYHYYTTINTGPTSSTTTNTNFTTTTTTISTTTVEFGSLRVNEI